MFSKYSFVCKLFENNRDNASSSHFFIDFGPEEAINIQHEAHQFKEFFLLKNI